MMMPVRGANFYPAKIKPRANGCVLTDRRTATPYLAWPLILIFGGITLFLMFLGIASLIFSLPPAPSHRIDAIFEAVIMLVAGSAFFALLLFLLSMLNVDRHYEIWINEDHQTCFCKNKRFGWTVQRYDVPFNQATWNIKPAVRHLEAHSAKATKSLASILLLFLLGPLSLLVLFVSLFARNRQTPDPISRTREVVQLVMSDSTRSRAIVTVEHEEIAEAFLLSWDRYTR